MRLFTYRNFYASALSSAVIFSKFSPPDDAEKEQKLISKAKFLTKKFKEERGVPGLALGVLVDGRIVWREGPSHFRSSVSNLCTDLADTFDKPWFLVKMDSAVP
uniref:Uncharacterized protein n=1 Tax=Romanomermis culicivorax TaxID=13658 RepID=A0A915HRA9_ROMCU